MKLNDMSREDLLKLRKDVDSALESLESRRREEARKAVEDAAKKHGFSLNDLVEGEKPGRRKSQKNAPKYRNPANPDQTWTGRGRQPGWIKDALAGGKSLESLAI